MHACEFVASYSATISVLPHPLFSSLGLFLWFEFERDAIDAVTLASLLRSIRKHVTKMSTTLTKKNQYIKIR